MFDNVIAFVVENSAPLVEIDWIVPPLPSTVPVPVIVRPPLAAAVPVLANAMPVAWSAAAVLLPLDTDRNVSPFAPIRVFCTLSAVALNDAIVLPVPSTVNVPPPVASKPVPL